MQDSEFWTLISKLAWKHAGSDDKVVAPVVRALAAMPAGEIVGFQNLLTEKLYALDGHDWARESGDSIWWGEPRVLSTDAFLYARCVVVANGPAFYEAVLTDPKAMPKDMGFEVLLYVAMKAYERKTGLHGDAVRGHAAVSYETFSNIAAWEGL